MMDIDARLALIERCRFIPIPPKQRIKIGGDDTDFRKMGCVLAGALVRFANLTPERRVLEIGCGIGRVALPLTQILNESGSYVGTDVALDGISWCREHITPYYPNFSFLHFDIYNEFYNPGGRGAVTDTPLPFCDGAFDLVFLTSVFTHLGPEDVKAYMREIRRVLAPGGTLWSTWFMVDHRLGDTILDGRSQVPLHWSDGTGVYFNTKDRGTLAVGYDEQMIDVFHANARLSIALKRRGSWCGRPDGGPGFQDAILAKPA
jgi:SAM-dependent methyltransferase